MYPPKASNFIYSYFCMWANLGCANKCEKYIFLLLLLQCAWMAWGGWRRPRSMVPVFLAFQQECTKDLERTLFIVVIARDVFTMKLMKISA